MNLKNYALISITTLALISISGCLYNSPDNKHLGYKEESPNEEKELFKVQKEMWAWQLSRQEDLPIPYDSYRGNNTCILVNGLAQASSINATASAIKGNITMIVKWIDQNGTKTNEVWASSSENTYGESVASISISDDSIFRIGKTDTLVFSVESKERFWKIIETPTGQRIFMHNRIEGIIPFSFEILTTHPNSVEFTLLEKSKC